MSELRDFERSLPMALMRARESVMRRFRPILNDHDLTEQQWRVLRALTASDASHSVGELANRTFLLGPSLSRMLVVLERRGLVARTLDETDGRRSEIIATAAGRQLVDEIAPHSERQYHAIERELGADTLDELYDLLSRVAAIGDT